MAPSERGNGRGGVGVGCAVRKGHSDLAVRGGTTKEISITPFTCLSNADLYLFLQLVKSAGKNEAVKWLAKEILLKKSGNERSRSLSRRYSIQSMQDIAENLYCATEAESELYKEEAEVVLSLPVGNPEQFNIGSCRNEMSKYNLNRSRALSDKA
eukprot:761101-Hanusia_phi.AAC.3